MYAIAQFSDGHVCKMNGTLIGVPAARKSKLDLLVVCKMQDDGWSPFGWVHGQT